MATFFDFQNTQVKIPDCINLRGKIAVKITSPERNNNTYIDTDIPNDNTLIMRFSLHVSVSIVCHSEDVWRELSKFPVLVFLDMFSVVDRKKLVRINCYQNGASVCLRK